MAPQSRRQSRPLRPLRPLLPAPASVSSSLGNTNQELPEQSGSSRYAYQVAGQDFRDGGLQQSLKVPRPSQSQGQYSGYSELTQYEGTARSTRTYADPADHPRDTTQGINENSNRAPSTNRDSLTSSSALGRHQGAAIIARDNAVPDPADAREVQGRSDIGAAEPRPKDKASRFARSLPFALFAEDELEESGRMDLSGLTQAQREERIRLQNRRASRRYYWERKFRHGEAEED